MSDRSSQIKLQRRQSLFLRELSRLIQDISLDEPALSKIFLTKVEFSPGSGMCYLYFFSLEGEKSVKEALEVLKLYKPSIRAAISKIRQSRYTPEIKFLYDKSAEKAQKMEEVLNKISQEKPPFED